MPTAEFRRRAGTTITLTNGGDFAFSPAGLANGAFWQSAKVNLLDGDGHFPQSLLVVIRTEMATAPAARSVLNLWWGPSTSSVAATDNPANLSGTDSSYTGYSSDAAVAVDQLIFIGAFPLAARPSGTPQVGPVGLLTPPTPYGCLVLGNASGVALHTTAANQAVRLILPEEIATW